MSKKQLPTAAQRRGQARAASLTPEQRREIASYAATRRWSGNSSLPKETHSGVLQIADVDLPCAVLNTGMRVFSQRGMFNALGAAKPSGKAGETTSRGEPLPGFLGSQAVNPFVSDGLSAVIRTPVIYSPKHAGRTAYGYEVTLLPSVCDALLDARKAGKLTPQQRPLADRAEALMRAFARVGIVALVDEVTGYQADRASNELQRILEKYISKELLPWTQKFPDEFFKQVYRLHRWEYREGNTKGPRYVGKVIKKYVYAKLPNGVLKELEAKNPPVDGRRRFKHFQWLTLDTGHPHLDRQIIKVITLMQVADDPAEFERLFKKAFPARGQQTELPLRDSEHQQ